MATRPSRFWSLLVLTLGATATLCAAADRPRLVTPEPTYTGPGQVRLLVVHGDQSSILAELAGSGAHLLAHLPDGALLVASPAEVLSNILGVTGSYAWTAVQAISPELAHAGSMAPPSTRIPIVIWLAPGIAAEPVARLLRAAGAQPAWTDERARLPQIGLSAPVERLEQVLSAVRQIPGLVWADIQPPVRLRNAASSWRCQSGHAWHQPVFDHGLHGEGQIIAILDTGIDADSCFFHDPEHGLPAVNDAHGTSVDLAQRKILAVDFHWDRDWPEPGPGSWDDDGHGTHVAGSAAGDQARVSLHDGNDGMAPAARLIIQDGGAAVDDCADLPGLGCPLEPLGPVLAQAYAQGARLHSNSWGDEENMLPHGRYTERTAEIDRFAWEHKDFLAFFAAGNDGPAADTVGSPATGKNVLAVGATLHGSIDPPCVAAFSSRGFTGDGRIKPDVLAPGLHVFSTTSDLRVDTFNCSAHPLSGTSMATPTVAGLAALVRQYLEQGFYPTGMATPGHALSPSAALVKATLIASAVDLSGPGCTGVEPIPSRDQGWGLVQLDQALYFAGTPDRRLLLRDQRDGFATSADPPRNTSLTVETAEPLKVVLVWTDYPSTAVAASNLVNDLDLVVVGPDGQYLGNALAGGASTTGGEPDRTNNVEVVLVPRPAPGTWRITVTPHTISHGPQDYALVATGALQTFAPHHAHGLAVVR